MVAFSSCSKKTGGLNMNADESMRKGGLELFKREKYEKAIPYFENTLMEAENPEMAAKAQLLLADAFFLDKKNIPRQSLLMSSSSKYTAIPKMRTRLCSVWGGFHTTPC